MLFWIIVVMGTLLLFAFLCALIARICFVYWEHPMTPKKRRKRSVGGPYR